MFLLQMSPCKSPLTSAILCNNNYSCWRTAKDWSRPTVPGRLQSLSHKGTRKYKNAMIFIPVPNCAKIELVYDIDGQTLENVMYFEGDHNPTEQDLLNLAADAKTQWEATWRLQQGAGCDLRKIKATDAGQEDGAAVEVSATGLHLGARNVEMMSNNVTACISLKTAKRGRSYRGRIYLPGITVDEVDTNTLAADTVTALTAGFSYWNFLDNGGEPWALVVASKFHNNAPRTVGVATTVTSFIVNKTVASQRRRLPGRGR